MNIESSNPAIISTTRSLELQNITYYSVALSTAAINLAVSTSHLSQTYQIISFILPTHILYIGTAAYVGTHIYVAHHSGQSASMSVGSIINCINYTPKLLNQIKNIYKATSHAGHQAYEAGAYFKNLIYQETNQTYKNTSKADISLISDDYDFCDIETDNQITSDDYDFCNIENDITQTNCLGNTQNLFDSWNGVDSSS